MKSKRQYQIIDAAGELVAEPFDSEREAYRALPIYQDHCDDLTLPLKVVPVPEEAERKQAA